MEWSLYKNEEFLKPLCFSNGKSQEDVVKEVLDSFEKGERIIFIHGICGTGKSAIALNIAKEMGKTSVVVPGKNLQNQYKKDYESEKYILGPNGKRLKINVITGRKNHECRFLKENSLPLPKFSKEVNSKLHDIFGTRRKEKVPNERDFSADNSEIPCKIEIKEKNWGRIREYLNKNPKVNSNNFSDIKEVKRLSIAPVCPYYSPVLPENLEAKSLGAKKKETYEGVGGVNCVFHQRTPGCAFYEQFKSYIDSDVIVFNSLKYKLEILLNRKPLTEVEIIDECDEFLDSFANKKKLNIDRLQSSLIRDFSLNEDNEELSKEVFALLRTLRNNPRVNESLRSGKIIPLKETSLYDILNIFLKSDFSKNFDDESYLSEVLETARMFGGFFEDTYLVFSKSENNLEVDIVTINLAEMLKQLIEKNKRLVLMSGTLHSEEVLKNIFGLGNFKRIDAENEHQGRIDIIRTGQEIDCKYSNFSSGKFVREDYLRSFDRCFEKAKRPILVHVSAYNDLPTEDEIEKYNLKNLKSREEIKEMQKEDGNGKIISDFKRGKIDILFSTRDSRGIDFPGEECNSIIFTKYPNPDIKDPFWKILNESKPNHYWSFYRDKARRELLQKLYRGLRFKEDHVFVLSPDSRVLDFFEKIDFFE
jgi:Rad3-related DNA helicase